jgi:hypothetical protein
MMHEFRRIFREVTKTEYRDGQTFRSDVARRIFDKAMEQGVALCNERNGITINAVKNTNFGVLCDVRIVTENDWD